MMQGSYVDDIVVVVVVGSLLLLLLLFLELLFSGVIRSISKIGLKIKFYGVRLI